MLLRNTSALFCLVLSAAPLFAQEAIFESGAELKTLSGNGTGREGPAWHPEKGVFTCGNGNINLLNLAGVTSVFHQGGNSNGLLLDSQGRLMACEWETRAVVRFEPDGTWKILADKYEGKKFNTPNDLTCDAQGRIYFTDPRYGAREGMEMLDASGQTIEGVYRIDLDGKVTRIIGRELERPNGILVSRDQKWLYVADNNNDATPNASRKLVRYPLKSDGTVDHSARVTLYDWGTGRGPDGFAEDLQGRLYVAAGLNRPTRSEPDPNIKSGIYVLSPEGKLLTFLNDSGGGATNCAFGGEDRKTLYITSGGTLFSIRTTTAGALYWPK